MNLQTAFLLRVFSVSFTYKLFGISSSFSSRWPEERIFLVFGLSLLVFFVAGVILTNLLLKIDSMNWKLRLSLSWLAFLMTMTLPMGMLAGIFFYDGFGIAYIWFIRSLVVRVVLAVVAVLIFIIFRPVWVSLFLRTAYSSSFLSKQENTKLFITVSFVLPWLAGVIIIIPFALLHHAWIWIVYVLGLGFVIIPFFGNNIPPRTFTITKSTGKIFSLKKPLFIFLFSLAILWVADFFFKLSF